jgi:hypothetical protein
MAMKANPRPSIRKPVLLFSCLATLAALLWWAYYERYHKYADCIDALTNSSCTTPDGGNLTAGGIFWGLLALPFTFVAAILFCVIVIRVVRRRSHGAI